MALDCLFRVRFVKVMRGTLIDGAGHGTTAASEEIGHIVRCRGGRQNILVEGVERSGSYHFLLHNFLVSRIHKAVVSLTGLSSFSVQGLQTQRKH